MLGVRLEPELEERLDWLAKETGHTKSYHAKAAIKKYLEDREDYLIAVAALERLEGGKAQTISLEDLVRKYELEDSLLDRRGKATRPSRQRSPQQNHEVRAGKARSAA